MLPERRWPHTRARVAERALPSAGRVNESDLTRLARHALGLYGRGDAELTPIRFINNAVFSVEPVVALDGDLLVEAALTVRGRVIRRHCDLLTWIDGRVLRPTRGLGPGHTFRLGEALGRLLPPEDWMLVRQVEERTRAIFAELDRSGSRQHVIHADFILGNCLFSRRGNSWEFGVLDFDDLGWGYAELPADRK